SVPTERIDCSEYPLDLSQADDVFTLDESDAAPDYPQGDEVILGLRLCEYLKDVSCRLIEGLDCREDFSAGHGLRFGENAFGPILINVKTEDLATELAVHDDTRRPDCARERLFHRAAPSKSCGGLRDGAPRATERYDGRAGFMSSICKLSGETSRPGF